jgi:DNA-binding MarR family transcriptional regulator
MLYYKKFKVETGNFFLNLLLYIRIYYTSKDLKGHHYLNIYFGEPMELVSVDTDKIKENFDIFFRRKPALMLVSLKKNTRMRYGSILAKEVDCTYSHAVKILQTLEDLKLVAFEKKGRIKVIQLTKKGREVADAIENIQRLIK